MLCIVNKVKLSNIFELNFSFLPITKLLKLTTLIYLYKINFCETSFYLFLIKSKIVQLKTGYTKADYHTTFRKMFHF